MTKITIISLLSYDYRYIYSAIESYYGIADEIILGLDCDRLTWAKNPFDIDLDEVKRNLGVLDTDAKIRIIEENFHKSSNPIENDTAERSWLSVHATPGNWIVQIDADEILLNPEEFKSWLIKTDPRDFNVVARICTVYKIIGNAALVTFPPMETLPVATKVANRYLVARNNHLPLKMSPLKILHYSWGRTEAELKQKLNNWGHKTEFDTEGYFKFWQNVDLDNYLGFSNIHPFGDGSMWWKLRKVALDGDLHQSINAVFDEYFRMIEKDIKRNDECYCGSGERYKHCHGKFAG